MPAWAKLKTLLTFSTSANATANSTKYPDVASDVQRIWLITVRFIMRG